MVKFIKYKNEDIPVRVSYYALKMLKEKVNKSISTLNEEDFEAWETLLYYSIVSGYRAIDKECPYKPEDSENIADEVFFEFMKVIPAFFPTTEKFMVDTKKGGLNVKKK
jgi:hypothetical protein